MPWAAHLTNLPAWSWPVSSGENLRVGIVLPVYLEPEMLHVHRHVLGLGEPEPVVITQKIKGRWPGPRPHLVRRSLWREVGRCAERLGFGPWQISRREVAAIARLTAGCDLLHLFFGNAAIHQLGLLRLRGRPAVVSFHGSDVTGSMASRAYAAARARLFRDSALVACRSHDLARQLVQSGCPAEKVRVLRTVLWDFPEAAGDWQPPGKGAWQIFHAGRMVPKKGGSYLLEAFSIFLKHYPSARLVMAGEGPLRAHLEALARQLSIAGQVEFPGFLSQEEMRHRMATSHIYVHPSVTYSGDREGVPNALLEAMAAGLPCVGTHHGGIAEAIEHGVSGLLVPEADVASLAAALSRLASHPELCAKLARAGRAKVLAEYSPQSWRRSVAAVYSEALQAGKSAKD